VKLKKIILAFILCVSVSAEAQSNALWTGVRTSYIFNNYSQPEFENDAVAVSLSPNGSICSNGGIPVFYSGAYNLYVLKLVPFRLYLPFKPISVHIPKCL
jgi:hypothetical protein